MSNLADIRMQMQETTATIAQLEGLIATNESPSLLANLESLQKRQSHLENEFAYAAAKAEVDVCDYRLFAGDHDRFSANAIADAIKGFQRLFSVVYDALKNGPKSHARISNETAHDTTLALGYTYAGSLGIAFTLPNERMLLGESMLDEAMSTVFEMIQAKERGDVSEFAEKLGAAPVRVLHGWAADHYSAGFGADIEWKREKDVRANVLVQCHEIESLKSAIEEVSETTTTRMTINGELVGADVHSRRFHFISAHGNLRGTFTDAIGKGHEAELPKRYTATIVQTKKTYLATGREHVAYFLEKLKSN